MDPNSTNNRGRSYNDVMNEWAAQRSFLGRSRNRLLHPSYDSPLIVRIFGYLFRVLVFLAIPALVYLLVLRSHMSGKEWNKQFGVGVQRYLSADSADAFGAKWTLGGQLSAQMISAKGSEKSFYSTLEAKGIAAEIGMPAVFRRVWELPRLSLSELNVQLRAGGLGEVPVYEPDDNETDLPEFPSGKRTGAVRAPASRLLRAGFGVSPDFAMLSISSCNVTSLTARWGASPATRGSVERLPAMLVRTGENWTLSGDAGTFSQGWLSGLKVKGIKAEITPEEGRLSSLRLENPEGGTVLVSGTVAFGDSPDVRGTASVNALPLHGFLAESWQKLVRGTGSGDLVLSGSVNKSSGVQMTGVLNVERAGLSGLPILRALQFVTGEDTLSALSFDRAGVEFVYGGTDALGGVKVEVKSLDLQRGENVRITGEFTWERKTLRVADFDSGTVDEQFVEGVKGTIRIGLGPDLLGKVPANVLEKYFPSTAGGLRWMEVPIDGKVEDLTRVLADGMIGLNKPE